MAIDLKEIRKTVIDTIKLAIGDDLSQEYNPDLDESYGMVFNARPNPEKAIPDYPYAVLDIKGIQDVDWYLTQLVFDEVTDKFQYETHKQIDMQITVYGGDATSLANKLATAYRRDDMIIVLTNGGLALADVQNTQILPELLQTDFLEVSFVQLSVRVNDISVDPTLESIENVILNGELNGTLSGDPLEVHIDTTST